LTVNNKYNRHTASLIDIMRPGIRAVRRNWAPFLLIQIIAATLVVAYYHFESVRSVAKSISDAKHAWGELFVIVSGAIAGGVLPQIAKIVTGKVKKIDRFFVADTLYNGFVFAVIAMVVNVFYTVQAEIFGTGIDITTLVKKTIVDMLFFSPFCAAPVGMFLLYARQSQFKIDRVRRAFSFWFYRAYVLPTLPPNWAYWAPVVLCVYALPSDLQFPFAQLAEGAWSLLFVFIAGEAGQG
jgi:hypothetical protein